MSDINSLNRSILELSEQEALNLIAESRARRRKPTASSIKKKAKAKKKASVKRTPKQNADKLLKKLTNDQKQRLLAELMGE